MTASRRRSSGSQRRSRTARHRRRQHRRQQGQRRPDRRLCRGRAGDEPGRGLPDDQHQLAQHARTARAAGRRRARRAARGDPRRRVPESRSSSRSRPTSKHGDPERIVRAAIDHKIDALIVANTTVSRPPLKSSLRGRGGRAFGRAAEAARARGAAPIPRGERRRNPADRRRRHRQRRRCVGADPRRREPGPALHGDGLRRPGHRAADRLRPGRSG